MYLKTLKIIFRIFFLITFNIIVVKAQLSVYNLSQFYNNYEVLNPSFVGSHEVFFISLVHRKQWVGFDGAPVYNILNLNWLMRNYQSGIGINFINEKLGLHKLNQLYINYSYRINLNETFLSFGLKGGIMNGNYFNADESLDPLFQEKNYKFLLPNFGLGVGMYSKNFYAGISIPEVFCTKLNDENKFILACKPQEFYYSLVSGYKVTVNNHIYFVPSILLLYNKIFSLDLNVGTNINYKNFFSGGLYYNYKKSINTVILFKLNYQALIGFSYDYLIGKLSNYMNGSIELIISYQFKYKVNVSNPLKF